MAEKITTGLYVITNCNCLCDVWTNSEPMDYEQALDLYKKITKQARRGFRPFPELLEIYEDASMVEIEVEL